MFPVCSLKKNVTGMKSHVYPRRDLGPGHQETQEAREQGNTYLSNPQGGIEHGKFILLM